MAATWCCAWRGWGSGGGSGVAGVWAGRGVQLLLLLQRAWRMAANYMARVACRGSAAVFQL
jgi:hypothetical protein